MKRSIRQLLTGIIFASLLAACAHHPKVVQAPTDSSFQGSIDRIDRVNELVTVQHWPLYKTFKVTSQCDITIPTNPPPRHWRI